MSLYRIAIQNGEGMTDQGKFVDKGRVHKEGEKDLQGVGSVVQMIVGAIIFLIAAIVSFSATSVFVCVWFTGWMVVGAVITCTGRIKR